MSLWFNGKIYFKRKLKACKLWSVFCKFLLIERQIITLGKIRDSESVELQEKRRRVCMMRCGQIANRAAGFSHRLG